MARVSARELVSTDPLEKGIWLGIIAQLAGFRGVRTRRISHIFLEEAGPHAMEAAETDNVGMKVAC
jgi:hypothetical protein